MAAATEPFPPRRHARVRLRGRIFVQVPQWPTLEAEGHDVSRGGIALILPRSVSPGDRLVFGLDTPAGQHRSLTAEVCWAQREKRNAYRVGMRWLGLGPQDEEDLRAFIDRMSAAA